MGIRRGTARTETDGQGVDAVVIDLRDRARPGPEGEPEDHPAAVTELVPGPRIVRSAAEAEVYVRQSGERLRPRDLPGRSPWSWVELAEALDRACPPADYAELRSLRPAVRPPVWLRVRVAVWAVVLAGASFLMLTLSTRELQSVAVLVALTALTLLFCHTPAITVPVSRGQALGHHEVMWALADIDLTEARRHRDIYGLPPSLSWSLAGLPERFAPASRTS
ncbi:MAG: hypothetical protein GY929_04880 [Actinomycetia bacterium]|nr:hypothetical protein [Actinomycetes bacterium]